jgi:hypothetical protein
MKLLYTLLICAFAGSLSAQTIWTGPTITFVKENFTDVTLEENQDRITDIVWITRGNSQGIFNAFSESQYTDFSSPADTEWAFGTTEDIDGLTFDDWESTHGSNPITNMLNQDMVVHLITDDIYIDIKFTAWQQGLGQGQPGGGGFTYERSSENFTSVVNVDANEAINLYPNPATDFITLEGAPNNADYSVLDQNGRIVLQGRTSLSSRIDLSTLQSGNYIVKVDGSSKPLRFNKQ